MKARSGGGAARQARRKSSWRAAPRRVETACPRLITTGYGKGPGGADPLDRYVRPNASEASARPRARCGRQARLGTGGPKASAPATNTMFIRRGPSGVVRKRTAAGALRTAVVMDAKKPRLLDLTEGAAGPRQGRCASPTFVATGPGRQACRKRWARRWTRRQPALAGEKNCARSMSHAPSTGQGKTPAGPTSSPDEEDSLEQGVSPQGREKMQAIAFAGRRALLHDFNNLLQGYQLIK